MLKVCQAFSIKNISADHLFSLSPIDKITNYCILLPYISLDDTAKVMDYTEPRRSVMSAKKYFEQLLSLARLNDGNTHVDKREAVLDADVIQSFYLECRIKNLRLSTIEGYTERLGYLVVYANEIQKPTIALDRGDLKQYILSIVDKVSPETVNGRIRVFKVFFNYLHAEGVIDINPMIDIRLLKTDKKRKPVLTPEQLSLFLRSFNKPKFTHQRNKMIALTLLDSMVRVGELVNLRIDDLDMKRGCLHIRYETKSRMDRVVPLCFPVVKAIHRYLVRYRRNIPGDFLFPYADGEPMKRDRVRWIFAARGRELGFRVYPHLLRHTGATNYQGSLFLLHQILGHSLIETTMLYKHPIEDEIIEAHHKYSPAIRMGVG